MINPAVITELQAIVGKDYVLSEREDLIIYSSDATVFSHFPDAVVRPGSTAEVAAVVKVAARHNIPVTGRGAATCLSGGTVPLKGGLVVELVRMNKIRKIDVDNKIVVTEAGVITFELITQVAQFGLLYPPDP